MLRATDGAVLSQIASDLAEFQNGHAPGSVPELRWLARRLRDPQCRRAVEDAIETLGAAGEAASAVVRNFLE